VNGGLGSEFAIFQPLINQGLASVQSVKNKGACRVSKGRPILGCEHSMESDFGSDHSDDYHDQDTATVERSVMYKGQPPKVSSRVTPPYARLLQQRLSRPTEWPNFWGTSPDAAHISLWAVTGHEAWEWAHEHKQSHLFALLPPNEDPESYRWDILKGHPPVLIFRAGDVDLRIVDRLAAALLRDGVERVLLLENSPVRYLPGQRLAA